MSARYMTPIEISAAIEGQLTPAEIEAAWRLLGFVAPVPAAGHVLIDLSLCAKHRTRLAREAMAGGMELPALTAAVLSCTAGDNLFAALMDG